MSGLEIERQARAQLDDFLSSVGQPPGRPPIDRSGGRPDNDDMERRLSELERAMAGIEPRLRMIETDVAVVKSNYATRADIADAKASIIMWVVGAIIFAQVLPALPGIFRAFGWIQ